MELQQENGRRLRESADRPLTLFYWTEGVHIERTNKIELIYL